VIRLALVDDDEISGFLIRKLVEKHNSSNVEQIELTVFTSPKNFLHAVGTFHRYYDIIVLDMHMGEMDGPELVNKLRRLDIKDSVILFYTNLIAEHESRTCLIAKTVKNPLESFLKAFKVFKGHYIDNVMKLTIRSHELNGRLCGHI